MQYDHGAQEHGYRLQYGAHTISIVLFVGKIMHDSEICDRARSLPRRITIGWNPHRPN